MEAILVVCDGCGKTLANYRRDVGSVIQGNTRFCLGGWRTTSHGRIRFGQAHLCETCFPAVVSGMVLDMEAAHGKQ